MAYLITHSLLSAWIYAMKENPYEDATSDADPYGDFIAVLHRLPTVTTDAMQNGIDFEDLVTDITCGTDVSGHKWEEAAREVSRYVRSGVLQFKASKKVTVDGVDLVLYGRFDCLKRGMIYDIKFSKSYERGKYINSTQHPMYLEILPEAERFIYLVSNGDEVWTEAYRREETPSIYPIISDFLEWLKLNGLFGIYAEKWQSKC